MISTKEECSLLLFLYDDMLISSEECNNRITCLFTSIESYNPKEDSNNKKSHFLLYYSKDENKITLKNRYYTCKIQINTHPISKIKEIKLQDHEGIVMYLHQTSISNKTFLLYCLARAINSSISSVIGHLKKINILYCFTSSNFISS